jgi:hypothetical protein
MAIIVSELTRVTRGERKTTDGIVGVVVVVVDQVGWEHQPGYGGQL